MLVEVLPSPALLSFVLPWEWWMWLVGEDEEMEWRTFEWWCPVAREAESSLRSFSSSVSSQISFRTGALLRFLNRLSWSDRCNLPNQNASVANKTKHHAMWNEYLFLCNLLTNHTAKCQLLVFLSLISQSHTYCVARSDGLTMFPMSSLRSFSSSVVVCDLLRSSSSSKALMPPWATLKPCRGVIVRCSRM